MRLILWLILLLPLRLHAQVTYHPFPQQNATWSVDHHDFSSAGWACITTFHYGINGDTIINGISYKKMYRNNTLSSAPDSSFNPATASYECAFREDSTKKVWAVHPNDTTAYILYDFALQLGDTFDFPYQNIFTTGDTVGYVDSIQLPNGQFRRHLQVGPDEWIEGIGSMNGPIDCTPCFVTSWGNVLLCHSDSTGMIWGSPQPNFCHCDLFDALPEINAPQFTINTSNSGLVVKTITNARYSLMVYNNLGALVYSNTALSSSATIPLLELPAGIYIAHIRMQDSGQLFQKLFFFPGK